MQLTAIDKTIINNLQGNFPIDEYPWKTLSTRLNIDEDILIMRIKLMQDAGYISRFGPLYNAEKMGGCLTLAAMKVDVKRYDEIADIVNSFVEVAHNYEREHELNMWFVVATETENQLCQVIDKIQTQTGCRVLNMPKQQEYFLGLKLEV
jgi:DNA-binding Lrp family transcriptional regulator